MSHDRRILLIANPMSAGGNLGRRWSALESMLAGQLGAFEHRFTEAAGDGTRLARQGLQQGFDMIVAMGGDGTISEVVNGLFGPEGTATQSATLGILHFGTGGDLCRTLQLPKKVKAGARALTGSAVRQLDVGRLHFIGHDGQPHLRHFINAAGFGIGALVDSLVNEGSKSLGGRVSFALATLRAIRRYDAQRVRMRLDDGPWHEVSLHNVAVCNGRFFGGGMHIAPGAKIDDGLFDVVVIGPMSMVDLLKHGHRVYRGTHLSLPQVSTAQAGKVEAVPLQQNQRIAIEADGETPGLLPATFEILPRALRVKVPDELP